MQKEVCHNDTWHILREASVEILIYTLAMKEKNTLIKIILL
jgi:hypothetical protein